MTAKDWFSVLPLVAPFFDLIARSPEARARRWHLKELRAKAKAERKMLKRINKQQRKNKKQTLRRRKK